MCGQKVISIRDNAVQCDCDPKSTELLVYRGAEPEKDSDLLGHYSKSAKSIIFEPFIPFMIGQEYVATCRGQVMTWRVPLPNNYEYSTVKGIYPSGSELPANLLKFNIQFSKPMQSNAYDYIKLTDENGEEIDRGLLLDMTELWNDDRTQLTVWIEPGRIKRGLGPHERLGPVLSEGQHYTLKINSSLRDQEGVPLENSFSKKFTVVDTDRAKPNVENWTLDTTTVDGKLGFVVHFQEAMDFGSAQGAFHVQDVPGSWSMLPGEKSILFEPMRSLMKGEYTIHVNPSIEDLAGNNLFRLFDEEIQDDNYKSERGPTTLKIKLE